MNFYSNRGKGVSWKKFWSYKKWNMCLGKLLSNRDEVEDPKFC